MSSEWSKIGEKVAAAKRLLDPHERDPALEKVLRYVDLHAGLKSTIRHRYGGQVVTNAWLKMYEITIAMGLADAARVPLPPAAAAAGCEHTHALRVFCNAELPGAFICALNHYLHTWSPGTRFEWVGSSLYPDPGDSCLGDYYGLFARNPARWLMSPEMRGDVTNVDEIRTLVASAKHLLGEVDLYTSDAGVDVSSDYGRQEELTARIHLGQTLAGLMSLRVGGALVAKTYTFVHPSSISLMAVCASVFETFYVTKPTTSRPANSEVYIVGLGFRGLAEELEELLLSAVESFDFDRPLVALATPETENTEVSLLAAARRLHGRQQVSFLEEAVDYFRKYGNNLTALREGLEPVARRAQAEWLGKNPVRPIPGNRLVASSAKPLESAARLAATLFSGEAAC